MAIRNTLVPILGALVLAGCAKEPAPQVEAARQAVESAQAADAAEYAAESWQRVEAAEVALDTELEAQRERSAMLRSYDHAGDLALDLRNAAEIAAADASTGRARASNDAAAAIDEAKALSAEVSKLLDRAPQGKGAVADVAALRGDAVSTEATLQEAETAYAAGRYADARAKARAVVESLRQVKLQVQAAQRARGQL